MEETVPRFKGPQKYHEEGDVVSASGSMRLCVEDRRDKGWGKVAEITAILSEMPKILQIEIGLKLREAKLINGILFNSEAWCNVSDRHGEARSGGHGCS